MIRMRACLRLSSVIDEIFIRVTEEFPARYLASVPPWQIYIQENHVRHPFIDYGSTTRARLQGKAHNCAPPKAYCSSCAQAGGVIRPAASASSNGQGRTDERKKATVANRLR